MNWKKTGRKFLFPPPAAVMVLVTAAAAALIYSFASCEATDPVSIAAYALSFYALVIVCLRAPEILRRILKFKRENRYIARYTADVRLRMNISLFGALMFNTVYAAFQLALGWRHHSVWFYTMAAYYFLLAAMRLLLMRYTGSHAPGEMKALEWKKYRFCGVCLLLMNLALGVMVTYFVFRIRIFRHHEITTICMAVYTFAALALAIRNVICYARYQSPAYSAAKAISLASAIVSVLTLENAMLTTFGENSSGRFAQIMLGATGSGVLLLVTGISLRMIIKAHKKLKQERTGANSHGK